MNDDTTTTLEATGDGPQLDEMVFELVKIGWQNHDWDSGTYFPPHKNDCEKLARAAASQVMLMYRALTEAIDADMEEDDE